ncbi:ATP-binding protein [Streptomyces roseirectus]|uniref:histidine kinase n=1 Tax=Streptomyces roseirectus TaxID=2768066 RepID=A0A7H0I8E2_9ACTN|nr:ATP-binding protein [Streptomyces roseirectus]QNP69058.1 ATP-binding protein [Streptomyces roseirectus]
MSHLRAPAARADRREGGRHGRPVARTAAAETHIRPHLTRLAVLPPTAVALGACAVVLFTVRATGARLGPTLWAVLASAAAVTGLGITVAAIAAGRTARSVTDRLDALRRATARSEADLRALVEALRRGETPPQRRTRGLPPADADEFELLAADLARTHDGAVTAVVQATQLSSRTGSEQKLEVFLNLARRLQSLVHREILLLDELENEIEDPDLLKGLFHVDHLATRVRRHAENLAVLGGAVSRRQWSHPVAMTEVLRSAIAEVEQYSRVKLVPPVDGDLRGHAVADVIHLLAELVENATVFSAPHTQVLLRANLVTSGLAVEVEDRGLGMPPDEQARMNALLADPDQVNVGRLLADGRIGLFVVSQLARRHGIRVRLQSNIYGGVQAVLVVPQELLGSSGMPGTSGTRTAAPSATTTAAPGTPTPAPPSPNAPGTSPAGQATPPPPQRPTPRHAGRNGTPGTGQGSGGTHRLNGTRPGSAVPEGTRGPRGPVPEGTHGPGGAVSEQAYGSGAAPVGGARPGGHGSGDPASGRGRPGGGAHRLGGARRVDAGTRAGLDGAAPGDAYLAGDARPGTHGSGGQATGGTYPGDSALGDPTLGHSAPGGSALGGTPLPDGAYPGVAADGPAPGDTYAGTPAADATQLADAVHPDAPHPGGVPHPADTAHPGDAAHLADAAHPDGVARPGGATRPAPLPVRTPRADRPTPAEAVPGIRAEDRAAVEEVQGQAPVPRAGAVRGTMEKPRLPRRRAQEHLAPQLRGGPAPRPGGEDPGGHDPGLMAAFQRGIGLAETQLGLEPDPTPTLATHTHHDGTAPAG